MTDDVWDVRTEILTGANTRSFLSESKSCGLLSESFLQRRILHSFREPPKYLRLYGDGSSEVALFSIGDGTLHTDDSIIEFAVVSGSEDRFAYQEAFGLTPLYNVLPVVLPAALPYGLFDYKGIALLAGVAVINSAWAHAAAPDYHAVPSTEAIWAGTYHIRHIDTYEHIPDVMKGMYKAAVARVKPKWTESQVGVGATLLAMVPAWRHTLATFVYHMLEKKGLWQTVRRKILAAVGWKGIGKGDRLAMRGVKWVIDNPTEVGPELPGIRPLPDHPDDPPPLVTLLHNTASAAACAQALIRLHRRLAVLNMPAEWTAGGGHAMIVTCLTAKLFFNGDCRIAIEEGPERRHQPVHQMDATTIKEGPDAVLMQLHGNFILREEGMMSANGILVEPPCVTNALEELRAPATSS